MLFFAVSPTLACQGRVSAALRVYPLTSKYAAVLGDLLRQNDNRKATEVYVSGKSLFPLSSEQGFSDNSFRSPSVEILSTGGRLARSLFVRVALFGELLCPPLHWAAVAQRVPHVRAGFVGRLSVAQVVAAAGKSAGFSSRRLSRDGNHRERRM